MKTTDDVAQATFLGLDDLAFRKEQQRKRAPVQSEFEVPEGRCCGRCENWTEAEKYDEFGSCTVLGVVTESLRDGPQKHEIGHTFDLIKKGAAFMELRTRIGFPGCSLFHETDRSEAA